MGEGVSASPFAFEKENVNMTPLKGDGMNKVSGSVMPACPLENKY